MNQYSSLAPAGTDGFGFTGRVPYPDPPVERGRLPRAEARTPRIELLRIVATYLIEYNQLGTLAKLCLVHKAANDVSAPKLYHTVQLASALSICRFFRELSPFKINKAKIHRLLHTSRGANDRP